MFTKDEAILSIINKPILNDDKWQILSKKFTYENGKLLSQSEYRASRQHGLYTQYYPSGKIKEQGEYVANKKHKEWKEYDEQGNVTKTMVFRAGILLEEK